MDEGIALDQTSRALLDMSFDYLVVIKDGWAPEQEDNVPSLFYLRSCEDNDSWSISVLTQEPDGREISNVPRTSDHEGFHGRRDKRNTN